MTTFIIFAIAFTSFLFFTKKIGFLVCSLFIFAGLLLFGVIS